MNHLSTPTTVNAKPAPVYDFTLLVERAVMTPDIPKIDPES